MSKGNTFDATFLQSLLPGELVLAPQPYTGSGQHPLLLMFNDTHLEANNYLNSIAEEYNTSLKLDYNEFIVMIPFVQFRDEARNETSPYCFLPVLYLDSLLAVLGGRLFWKFKKLFLGHTSKFRIITINTTIYTTFFQNLHQRRFSLTPKLLT